MRDNILAVVAGGLILIALVGLGGMIWIVHDYQVDPATLNVIVAPTSAALGALGALLATKN